MSEPIVIVVDCIPMGKQRAKHGTRKNKKGKQFTVTYTPDKTVHFEEMLRHAAKLAMAGRPALNQACICDVEARFPLPQSATKRLRAAVEQGELVPHTVKPDKDNVDKIVFDGIVPTALTRDQLIFDGRTVKRYAVNPGLTITLTPV